MEHINLLRFLAPFPHHICTLMLVMNVMLCILIVYYECCRKLHWCMFCTKWQNKPYKLKTCFHHFTLLDWSQGHTYSTQWASYQIRKLRIAHVLGMPGTLFPPTSKETVVSDPGMHHGTCVTHVSWCMSRSLTCGGEENVPDIPGASVNQKILRIWQEAYYNTLYIAATAPTMWNYGTLRKSYSRLSPHESCFSWKWRCCEISL